MDKLEKRFQSNIYSEFPTNCIGNLLYLSGKTDEEHSFEPIAFYKRYFKDLEKISKPSRGNIVLWEELVGDKEHFLWEYEIVNGEKRILLHGGIIGSSDLKEVYHRPGSYSELLDQNAKSVKDTLDNINNWVLNAKDFQGKTIIMNFYKWKKI